jgi:hypothetical protein
MTTASADVMTVASATTPRLSWTAHANEAGEHIEVRPLDLEQQLPVDGSHDLSRQKPSSITGRERAHRAREELPRALVLQLQERQNLGRPHAGARLLHFPLDVLPGAASAREILVGQIAASIPEVHRHIAQNVRELQRNPEVARVDEDRRFTIFEDLRTDEADRGGHTVAVGFEVGERPILRPGRIHRDAVDEGVELRAGQVADVHEGLERDALRRRRRLAREHARHLVAPERERLRDTGRIGFEIDGVIDGPTEVEDRRDGPALLGRQRQEGVVEAGLPRHRLDGGGPCTPPSGRRAAGPHARAAPPAP